jgi:hypothetical protein
MLSFMLMWSFVELQLQMGLLSDRIGFYNKAIEAVVEGLECKIQARY